MANIISNKEAANARIRLRAADMEKHRADRVLTQAQLKVTAAAVKVEIANKLAASLVRDVDPAEVQRLAILNALAATDAKLPRCVEDVYKFLDKKYPTEFIVTIPETIQAVMETKKDLRVQLKAVKAAITVDE